MADKQLQNFVERLDTLSEEIRSIRVHLLTGKKTVKEGERDLHRMLSAAVIYLDASLKLDKKK